MDKNPLETASISAGWWISVEQTKNILFLWDWENTAKGMRENEYAKGNYDLSAGFDRLNQWLTEIGKVIRVLLFSPMHKIFGFDATFQRQEFSIVLCPKIPRVISPGVVEYIDTTDANLIRHGEFCIDHMPDIGYLCLGSGDTHFAPLLRAAKNRGIKIMVVYGSEMSLSSEIWNLADKDPKTGKKMVHLFSPTKNRT